MHKPDYSSRVFSVDSNFWATGPGSEVGPDARLILFSVMRFGGSTGKIYASATTLCRAAFGEISERQSYRKLPPALRELEKAGLIKNVVARRGLPTSFDLTEALTGKPLTKMSEVTPSTTTEPLTKMSGVSPPHTPNPCQKCPEPLTKMSKTPDKNGRQVSLKNINYNIGADDASRNGPNGPLASGEADGAACESTGSGGVFIPSVELYDALRATNSVDEYGSLRPALPPACELPEWLRHRFT